jgi:hypothetical protein
MEGGGGFSLIVATNEQEHSAHSANSGGSIQARDDPEAVQQPASL